ncbi:hypothetical protein [Paenibacillus oleatilyticus]|uniref:DZANK-type domain-containing protein n=1 Tax=Paenibacillus oleatilyticus TaxID=2594886 RepID=A0ABV4VCH2_9BACL
MKNGVMNASRREANFISRMGLEDRERYIKRFIASCNPEQLVPFIRIIRHDKNFRTVEYAIDISDVAQIVHIERYYGGYRYVNCPECKTEIQTSNPILLKLPYCGSCGKSVADAAHKYCGWCGSKFDGQD